MYVCIVVYDTHITNLSLTCGTACIAAAVDSVYMCVSPLTFLAWSHDHCGCHGNKQGGSWQSKDLEMFIREREKVTPILPPLLSILLPPHTHLSSHEVVLAGLACVLP